MLGPKQEAQAALFYEFSLEDHVPQDHMLRSIDRFVDLSSIRAHLADFYSHICPEGEALKQFRRNYSDPNRGPTGKGVAKYRALKNTCQACPSKTKCCPNLDFRSITREKHEDARDIARAIAKTSQYKLSAKLRKKVEMLFAHLKRILGLGRLRLRGPSGANDEFLLAATVQNLRKLAKIFPAPQQPRRA